MTNSPLPKIAIIGTGMAGLACADALGRQFDISLFDKSRGLSGRLSTRRAEAHAFDHGAQLFHATTKSFADWLKPFEAAGHVRHWSPRHMRFAADGTCAELKEDAPKLVFAPGMSAIGKALVAGRPQWKLYLDTGIDAVEGEAGIWSIWSGGECFGPFAHVVFAMPAPQVFTLAPHRVSFRDDVAAVTMLGCHTLMLGYTPDEAPAPDWGCAHFDDEMLGFAAVNSAKPGRGGGFGVVLQTRHDWSQAHIEDDVEAVAAEMKERFTAITGCSSEALAYARVHRWRFASSVNPAGNDASPYLLDGALGLSAIGDWCRGSKLEDAFLSGRALAAKLIS